MSIRLRIALWYGALTGVVVLLLGLLTYAEHSRTHYDDLDRALRSTAEHVASEYAAASSANQVTTVFRTPLGSNFAVRVYGAGGEIVAATPNAPQAPRIDLPATLARPALSPLDPIVRFVPMWPMAPQPEGTFGLTTDTSGARWRLYVQSAGRPGQYLVALSPLAQVDDDIGTFRLQVLLYVVVVVIGALIVARLIAGHALAPVAVLTATARGIAHSRDFRQRVPVGSDRDELGQLETTFNTMLASLEEAYEAQQRFVADASHELRAPLTAIQANLELLARQPNLTPVERQEAADEATKEAQRLARLVADLLSLARADAGVSLRRQPVELDRVVLDVLAEERRLLQEQRLEITDIEPMQVVGDPDRLKQVVVILVDNALRYTPSGGEVSLGLRRVGRRAELTVRDTGIGIAPEDLPHVFERFYRADRSRARDPGGTGLGLPIAQWIAEQHGGEVTLTSELGKGTVATLCLPLSA